MAANIGPRIGIDGEKEFRQELNNIIQQTRTLGSEMKAVTSAFDNNTKATEKNVAKAQVLNKQIDAQKSLIDKLSKGLQESAAKFGENDTRTLKWQNQLNNATAELNNMERELKNLGNAEDSAGESAVNLGDMIRAHVIGSAITAGIGAVTSAIGKMKDALVDAGKQAISSFADYEQLTGGIETLFGDSMETVMQNAKKAWKDVGLSANDYMEQATSTAASMISSLGGDTQKAADLTNLAITDMADNANKMGTSIEMIQNAYSGFAKQNYTMLDNLKLGYGGTKEEMERLLNDAQKLSGIQYDISSYSDIVQAIHEIQTEMQITGTTAAEATETISGSAAAAKASWSDFLMALVSGENIEGSMKNLSQSVKTMLSNIQPAIKKLVSNFVSYLPDMISFGGEIISSISDGILSSLPDLGETAMTLFQNLTSYIQENLPTMIQNGLQALLSFAQGFRSNVGILIENGISMMKSIAQGIVAALPDFISQVPLIISEFANTINDNMPKILSAGVEIIYTLVSGIISNIPTIIENIPQIVSAIWDTLMAVNWLNLGSKILSGVGNGIKSMAGQVKEAAKGGISGAIDWIKSLPSQAVNWGKDMIQGFINGIKSMVGGVIDAVSGIANTIAGWLHFSRPDVGPLREYEKWMPDFVSGMAEGLRKSEWMIQSAISNIASGMVIDMETPSIASSNTSSSGFSGSINVNVYAAEGQDERLIADRVAEIIDQKIQTKRGVFA